MTASLMPHPWPRRTGWEELLERESAAAELTGALDSLGNSGSSFAVMGTAGTGKSVLLETLAEDASARGYVVLRCTGVPCEVTEAGAALHELLHPVLDLVDQLPSRHQTNLLAAFGLVDGPRPDRLALSLATLDLITIVAHRRPVVLVIDDLQWVDSVTHDVLSFVGRRLRIAPILTVAGVRSGGWVTDRSLPWPVRSIALEPLSDEAAQRLVDRVSPGLRRSDRNRVLAAAQGNPLALVELARSLRDAGGEYEPEALHATRRLAGSMLAGVVELPAPTRRFLVLIAASDRDLLPDLMPAAQLLGLHARDLAPAEQAGVVHVIGDRVTFEQPLLRFALYGSAPWAERSEAHNALATTTRDHGRAVWHRAALVQRGDEAAATELENASRRYALAGALDEAIRLLQRSAVLSPSASDQAGRLAFAAELSWQVGRPRAARDLIGEASGLSHDSEPVGQLSLTESVLALTVGSESPREIVSRSVREARAAVEVSGRVASVAPVLVASASLVWHHSIEGEVQCALQSLVDAAVVDVPVGGSDTWDAWTTSRLLAMARAWIDPLRGAEVRHLLPEVVSTLRQRVLERGQGHRRNTAHLVNASARTAEMVHDLHLARALWDLADEAVSATHGASGDQARLLVEHALTRILTGQLATAESEAPRGLRMVEDLGLSLLAEMARANQALIAAWTAPDARLETSVEAVAHKAARTKAHPVLRSGTGEDSAAPTGSTSTPTSARTSALIRSVWAWGQGLMLLRLNQPQAAWPLITAVATHPSTARMAVADVVEVATLIDDPNARAGAVSLVQAASAAAEVFDSAHLRSLVLRSRALLGDGDVDTQFRESAAQAVTAGAPLDRGRTLLAHGAWLRRSGQVVAAREVLEEARFVLSTAGAAPWAERATDELRAAGVTTQGRATAIDLTALNPQELEIARLAASGLTNKQIAAQLYCSHRTVGSYLYKIFPKLGVTSRAQLREALRGM